MTFKEIDDTIRSLTPFQYREIEFWCGSDIIGNKTQGSHLTFYLQDGRKLHLGIRWATITGEKK
jgi:hypothetical protein